MFASKPFQSQQNSGKLAKNKSPGRSLGTSTRAASKSRSPGKTKKAGKKKAATKNRDASPNAEELYHARGSNLSASSRQRQNSGSAPLKKGKQKKGKKTVNVQDVDSDGSGRGGAGAQAKRMHKGMPKATKKSPYRYTSSPYNDYRGKSKGSSSATEDEIGYDSESDDYGTEHDYDKEVSAKKKKKDKRRHDLDFENDYRPLRLGVKAEKRLIVIEY